MQKIDRDRLDENTGKVEAIGPDAVYRKQWSIMSANRNVEHWINL